MLTSLRQIETFPVFFVFNVKRKVLLTFSTHQTPNYVKNTTLSQLLNFFNSKPLNVCYNTQKVKHSFPQRQKMEGSNSRGQRSKTGVDYHLAAEEQKH